MWLVLHRVPALVINESLLLEPGHRHQSNNNRLSLLGYHVNVCVCVWCVCVCGF